LNYYRRILPWENNRRLDKLAEFRALVIQYFNNSRAEWMVDGRIEKPDAEETRVKINRMMDETHDIILCSGVNPSIRHIPPAVVGGYIQNIDLVQNVFNLNRFQITANNLLDFIDRSIGIYESNNRPALLRAINPFFYLGLALDLVARIPFVIIGRAGFNRQKVEESLAGRLVKESIYIVTALASLLTVLQLLDYLESFKQVVKNVFRKPGGRPRSLRSLDAAR
jgi:hypothetical protein